MGIGRKEYYKKNCLRICELQRIYYWERKKKIAEYYAKLEHGEEIEYSERIYLEYLNKQILNRKILGCKRLLEKYAYNAINFVKNTCKNAVDSLYEKYPFNKVAEPYIKKTLKRMSVYSFKGAYNDCYDAGMLAYVYSIHRCAYINFENVIGYIRKMIQIYIKSALVVYNDSANYGKLNDINYFEYNIL